MTSNKKNIMVGKWLPSDRDAVMKWLSKRLERLKRQHSNEYNALKKYLPDGHCKDEEVQEFVSCSEKHEEIAALVNFLPPVNALLTAICTEPDVCMSMVEMFDQPDSQPKEFALNIRDFLFTLNSTLREAPKFNADIQAPCPVGCLLTYAMKTPAGFAAFTKRRINELFKDILDNYGAYLQTNESASILSADVKDGWFTEEALNKMPDFVNTFNCDPNVEHWGFTSFDDFFTRTFKNEARPIASPLEDLVIVNACENAPFQISYNVLRHAAFWIKSQPYSLQYVLDNDDNLGKFVGGTIYQGYLSAHCYHRFHAPVSGEIITARIVSGTYFSQPYFKDSQSNYVASQPYLAHVAARGIIIIDTKNKDVGLVAFVPIGMVDVSTIDLFISEKSIVKKGDNIGTFRFGGSSHLLIFEKGVHVDFDLQGIEPDRNGQTFLNVRSRIGTVVPN